MPKPASNRLDKLTAAAFATAAIALLAAPSPARAESGPPGPPPIPEEAFTACQSKSEGAACSVDFRDRAIEGTCARAPSDARLACRPNEPPPPPPGPPPPQSRSRAPKARAA